MFDNNSAGTTGGGIEAVLAALDIENSTISNNDAGSDGGGISAAFGSSVTIAASAITGNTAGNDGGGISSLTFICCGFVQTLTITDSTIARNTAGRVGGGIATLDTPVFLGAGPPTIITITGSTINDNVGFFIGGIGIDGGTLSISNSTVSGNEASAGTNHPAGLASVRGSATLDSVTIADNVQADPPLLGTPGGGLGIGNGTITNTLLSNNSPLDCVTAPTRYPQKVCKQSGGVPSL